MSPASLALALALALVLVLSGCTLFQGEGAETLVVENRDVQPVQIVVSITQEVGELEIFGESVRLASGASQEYAIAARPGAHRVLVTTSTSIQEFVRIEVPTHGDMLIEVVVRRGSATVSTTSRG